jgi:hypothetical protein
MKRIRLILGMTAFLLALLLGTATAIVQNRPADRLTKAYPNFELDVIVNGRPLSEYYARGRVYVEALHGAEYELRLRNNSADRVAVALSVDGLNTIDARHTSAWNASKWVIEPYQTITISGWQMSSERARRFYFTNERDSYGAKLGQTANLGVISAVFFRERRPVPIIRPPYPITREKSDRMGSGESSARAQTSPRPDHDNAATGIGRNVHNDVRWVDMDLDSRAAGEVTIRYEYRRHPREISRDFCPEPKF